MRLSLFALAIAALALPAGAQQLNRTNVANILGFENGNPGQFPPGWGFTATATGIANDNTVFHGGRQSARIERTSTSPQTFNSLIAGIPIDFTGRILTYRGWIKTENVSDAVSLWMRADGERPNLAFATTQGQGVRGTTDWRQYSVSMNLPADATTFVFGALLSGTGKAWYDDIEILVDNVPVARAPSRINNPFDKDKEFDGNSRVTITSLSELQIQNLATLARVWGFLKYHHPAVTSAARHWDYDLFRALPPVLAATTKEAANRAISTWIAALGPVPDCTRCATLNTNGLYLSPTLEWLDDESLLGADLSRTLRAIYRNRTAAYPAATPSFYISMAPNIGNPVFSNELTYSALRFPDAGYQLLGLFRFWNMIEYFSPYRDIMADDPAAEPAYWNTVLAESIAPMALAKTATEYQQEMIKFIAKMKDTHANLWSSLAARPPIGNCQLPVDLRFVEGKPIVLRWISPTAGPESGLQPGDLIEELDNTSVADLVQKLNPFFAASNQPTRLRDIANAMTRGDCGPVDLLINRNDELLKVTSNRVARNTLDFSRTGVHDLPGDAFQKLSDEVAYIKLSEITVARVAEYIRAAAGTNGLIIDIRNYPKEFVVFALGQLLVAERTPFVRFTMSDPVNPGALRWSGPVVLTPQQPRYTGKVVILVDEVSQSQSEYTTMAFRTAPGAIVIGSTTAGADGDVSFVPLPFNMSSYISGNGIFYPDNTPTQRIGIIPDIFLEPTIAGIRAGKDELIEEAIRQITAQ